MSLLRAVTNPSTSRRTRAAGVTLLTAAVAAWAAPPDAPQQAGATQAPVVDASPPATDPRLQAQADFKRLLDAGDFAGAAAQAGRIVELTERTSPVPAEELQVALMNLALAQHRAGDYVAAETSYLRVIDLIETSGRRASPRLARAYAGLATTYYAARRYDLAATSFERAIALNRRAEGLYNPGQLPLLDKQANTLTELGRAEEAQRARRYALRVVARNHGEQSLEFARELESLGRWYTRVGSYDASRSTLRGAAEIVVEIGGPNSLDLLGPLTGVAENARQWLRDPALEATTAADEQRRAMFQDAVMPAPPSLSPSTIAAEGQKALERAASIVATHPDASPALAAGVQVQLGDWYQVRQQPERALPFYRQAWQSTGRAPDGAQLRQSLFGGPVLLQYDVPAGWNRYAARAPTEAELRYVELQLTVTTQGRPRDPRPVGTDDEQRLVNQALRAIGTASYRPRLVDGEPVETTGVRFTQPFYVLREAEPAAAAPLPAKPPAQGGD